MLGGGSRQEAGDESVQLQAGRDLVVGHIPEGAAREIVEATARIALESYQMGESVAAARMQQLEERVIDNLSRGGTLGALADPAVQVTLRKAQISAAATEREADYELLAELLNERIRKSSERPIRAGINRAAEVVGELDVTALRGLTLFYLASTIVPRAADPDAGIRIMSDMIGSLLDDGPLPTGEGWLEHLDILDAVRVSNLGSFKPFNDYWPARTPGYVSIGVEPIPEPPGPVSGEDAHFVALMLSQHCVDHRYKPGFKRLAIPYIGEMERWLASAEPSYRQDMLDVARNKFHVESLDNEACAAYMQEVLADQNLSRLAEWWQSLPYHFTVTVVGKVIANANGRRLDESVPSHSLE